MELIKYASERQILGSLVLHPEKFAVKIPILSDDLFADQIHLKLFRAIRKTYDKTSKLDLNLVLAECCDAESKTEIYACAESIITTATFDEHLNELNKAAKQRFISAAIENMRLDGEYSASKLIDMCTLANRAYTNSYEKYGCNIYNSFLNNLNKPKDVLYTNLSIFNKISGGIRKGTIFIIGARPSTGKTALALNFATYNALKGKKILFFSLEMTKDMIIERLISSECNINYNNFMNRINENEQCIINNFFSNKGKAITENLNIIDDINAIETICSYIDNTKPELVLIDFIQIVTTLSKMDNARARIDYISSELKRVAKRTNCCVIVLSQLSRTGKETPTMSDLKESGGLEQDGDYIALLDRPYVNDKANNNPNEANLLIDKNKFGRTGIIKLNFDGEHQRFTERTY